MVARGTRFSKTRFTQGRLECIWCVPNEPRGTDFIDSIYFLARSKTLTKLAIDWQDTLKKAASED